MRAPACLTHIAFTLFAAGVSLSGQQRAVKVYTAADGLGHNRVKCIYGDSKGFLWFCTSNGLTRFDGLHFLNFGSDEGAPFLSANDVLELPGGNYWIASNGQGVIRFHATGSLHALESATVQDRFTPYRVSDDPAGNRVNVLYPGRDGTVWLGSDGGLFRLADRQGAPEIRPVPLGLPRHPDRQTQVTAITEDGEGGIFAGTRFGLVRIPREGTAIHYPIERELEADTVAALTYNQGVLWIGHQAGLILWRPTAIVPGTGTAGRSREDPVLTRVARSAADPSFPGLPARPGEARFYAAALCDRRFFPRAD